MEKELSEKTLTMPPNERLAFAELILASLEHEEKEIRTAWVDEVNERIKAVNEGRSTLLDFEALNDAG
jgi:putative addiction module component (TIGR02574 family)